MKWRAVWCGASLAVSIWACSLNKQARSLVASGLGYLNSDSGRRQIRALTDSSLHGVAVSFREQLKPGVDSAVQELLGQGRAALGRSEESLAVAVEGPLSTAVAHLVRDNLRSAGTEGRAQLDLIVQRMGTDLERDLTPALQRSVTAATKSFMTQLSANVQTELRQAAESALRSTVRAGVQTGGNVVPKTPLWRTALGVVGLLVAAIVFLGIAWLIREHRRNVAALEVVTQEIHRSGSPALKAQIQRRASERQVEGWLRRFLVARGSI